MYLCKMSHLQVLFQYLARRDPITYEMLLRAVEPLQEESMA